MSVRLWKLLILLDTVMTSCIKRLLTMDATSAVSNNFSTQQYFRIGRAAQIGVSRGQQWIRLILLYI